MGRLFQCDVCHYLITEKNSDLQQHYLQKKGRLLKALGKFQELDHKVLEVELELTFLCYCHTDYAILNLSSFLRANKVLSNYGAYKKYQHSLLQIEFLQTTSLEETIIIYTNLFYDKNDNAECLSKSEIKIVISYLIILIGF